MTQSSEDNQQPLSPKFAVAVAGRPSIPTQPRSDEAPSVLSPLGNVLSIVSMRTDPSEDHEAVKVVAYSIEKALSHAELTWAADPFRNTVSETGKPSFNIDFSKRPAAAQTSETRSPPKQLHNVPMGRAPVSLANTRHLGRVETRPSANNRLRQSFADEEAKKFSQHSTDERSPSSSDSSAKPRNVSKNISRRPRPDDASEVALKQKSAPLLKELTRRTNASLGRKPQGQSEITAVTKQTHDSKDSTKAVSRQSQVAPKKKTTLLEDLTWTPALLQKDFDREQLSAGSRRQPKNPDDIFVFFRS